jgi:hypothetical protein
MRTFAWILLPLSFAQLACAEESTSQPGSPPDAAGAATQPTPVGTYDGPALLKKLRADEVKPLVESIPGGAAACGTRERSPSRPRRPSDCRADGCGVVKGRGREEGGTEAGIPPRRHPIGTA